MSPQEVKKFVFGELNLSETEDSDRICEMATRQAFSATKFLLELQQNPDLDIPNMFSVEALAREVLGNRWERKLQKTTIEDLQEEASYLWEDSGFDKFLVDSIQALINSVAPKCIASALNKSRSLLANLKDDLSLRAKAISQDAEKLEAEINSLATDLQHLDICRSRLKTVDEIKQKLRTNLNKIFLQLKQESQVSIKDYFKEEDYNQANIIQKIHIKATEGAGNIFPSFVTDPFKNTIYSLLVLQFLLLFPKEKLMDNTI